MYCKFQDLIYNSIGTWGLAIFEFYYYHIQFFMLEGVISCSSTPDYVILGLLCGISAITISNRVLVSIGTLNLLLI